MKYKDEDPDNLGGLGDMLPADVLQKVNELLEQLHWTDHTNQGSKIEFVIEVALLPFYGVVHLMIHYLIRIVFIICKNRNAIVIEVF